MAVVEIAKIQIRRGDAKVTGTPNLDSGEFGWAVAGTDPESNIPQLFIGNGTEAEGARIGPGSTRILTQYDNILDLSSTSTSYTYKATHRDLNVLLPNVVSRTVQSKLDDNVTVFDFGESVTSQNLQNAIDDLFLYSGDKDKPQSRMALRIPAGDYTLDDTVYIPPYTTIIGEGQDKTVLTISDSSKSIFQFCDQTSGPGSYVLFQEGLTNIQSSTRPANITLIGLTLKYDADALKINASPLLYVDCAIDSYISNCKFVGAYEIGNTSDTGYAGMELRGQGAITTENLIVDNCTFDSLYYGIKSNHDVKDNIITKSRFRNLRKGIVFKENTISGNAIGPSRMSISGNKFEAIEQEGIYSGTSTIPTYNSSSYNIFVDVGDSGAGFSIINFLSQGNTSTGDNFRRFLDLSTSTSVTSFKPLVSGKNYVDHNSVYSSNIVTAITSATVLAKFPYSVDQEYKVHYSVVKSPLGVSRKGDILINVSLLGSNTTATITDSYTYSGTSDGGVEFSVGLNTTTNTVSLGYTSPDAVGTISYKFSQFQ
jgi:hypothetical protein